MSYMKQTLPEQPEQDDLGSDSDFWSWVLDMERDAEAEQAKADAQLGAERDLQLLRQAGAL